MKGKKTYRGNGTVSPHFAQEMVKPMTSRRWGRLSTRRRESQEILRVSKAAIGPCRKTQSLHSDIYALHIPDGDEKSPAAIGGLQTATARFGQADFAVRYGARICLLTLRRDSRRYPANSRPLLLLPPTPGCRRCSLPRPRLSPFASAIAPERCPRAP